ncbi:hypothetical protein BC477_13810 [Clavibacter michiganensis subsp. michiganensis]|uniref:Uncharacterized protein n=1 Tax=Clavibacter michiganensis subsp. michiganensis TaxID=33013 RepID=A0A251XIZ0_CLAMM|nr:hypothetical protein BC477_13810 [Clavibacter michiganensis subsp. michiganensis]OUE02873.1 hypothetical protein CMMCAS07_12715 [Clavibacter michiganensis subsp. michiganensis]
MSRVPRHSCRGTLGPRRSPVRRLRQRKRRVAARPHVPSPGPHLHARRSCRSTQQCGFPNPEDHRQLLEVPSGRMRSSTSARSSRQQNPRLSGGALALRMPSAPDQTLHLAKSVPFARAPRPVTYRNAIATCDATGAGSRRRSPAADSHRDAGSATRVGCCASPDRRAVAGGPADGSAMDGMVSGRSASRVRPCDLDSGRLGSATGCPARLRVARSRERAGLSFGATTTTAAEAVPSSRFSAAAWSAFSPDGRRRAAGSHPSAEAKSGSDALGVPTRATRGDVHLIPHVTSDTARHSTRPPSREEAGAASGGRQRITSRRASRSRRRCSSGRCRRGPSRCR